MAATPKVARATALALALERATEATVGGVLRRRAADELMACRAADALDVEACRGVSRRVEAC